MASQPIVVVSGVGNATGTGAAVARAFARKFGYRVALIARRQKDVDNIANGIKIAGGEAKGFAIPQYNHENIQSAFRQIKSTWPDARIKCCVWNTSEWSRIPFLDVKKEDIERSVQINIVSAFAFAQEAIRAMLGSSFDPAVQPENIPHPNSPEYPTSPGGTLLLTGATSGTRGAANFATFASGKHGLRAMSQSLAREFGKHGIHVAHVVVDGTIRTDATFKRFGQLPRQFSTPGAEAATTAAPAQGSWMDDESRRLSAESIADVYTFLHGQERSCWTLEMDVRPAKEHF